MYIYIHAYIFLYIYVHTCSNVTHLSKDSASASKPSTVRTKKPHVFGFYAVMKNLKILYKF